MGLTWEVFTGADGVHYAHQGRYTARVVEGRVWRWQVGDEREPARLSGRTTRGMGEAQEACALAVRLLELSDAGADVKGLPAVADSKDPDRQERERAMPAERIGERMRQAMHLYGADTAQEFAARAMDLWHEFHDAWKLGCRAGYEAGADEAQARAFADSLVKVAQEDTQAALREMADLKDQVGERDGVIAQLRAKLEERDGALTSKVAQRLREEGEIKVGDRVVWRTAYSGTLTGVVVDTWQTPDGLCCQVKDDKTGARWGALSWTLEVV